jgi:hypothetical protein
MLRDTALGNFLICAWAVICFLTAVSAVRGRGPSRFPGARVLLWSSGVVLLPVPLYFAMGIGFWIGAALGSVARLDLVGAVAGAIGLPAALCFATMRLLAAIFTRRPIH